ncbi:hypothetical protein RJT34_16504 [Clitoria ternatea]|uniref:Uncharacterized protein n=1 Tax=Clitoria ternatea TaxID=43366 RepID=A0AAN9J7J9_CLITE
MQKGGNHQRLAMAETAYAKGEITKDWPWQRGIRKQVQAELAKPEDLRKQAIRKTTNTLIEITCQACKQQFQSSTFGVSSEETLM